MIKIPFNPDIFSSGSFILSWHGFLSFVAVATAVYLIARWARRDGLDPDIVYNTATWAILGGIIGARVVHVADNWDLYRNDLASVFQIWSGGIGLWGAILGGWLAGTVYAYISKYPIGKLMDLSAPALLIAQTIGRVGDIINGEHCARATDLPWGWAFTNHASPARACITTDPTGYFGPGANPETPVHPAVVYEMIWDMLALAVIWRLRGRLRPDGAVWFVYLALYSIGRFSIQFLRLDDPKFWGLQEAHLIAILVLAVAIPYIVLKVRFKKPGEDEPQPPAPSRGRLRRQRQREAG